jgi:hypothetical protein
VDPERATAGAMFLRCIPPVSLSAPVVVSRTAARNAFLPRIAASCQATRGQSAGRVCPIIDQSGGTLVGFASFYGSLCREDATVGAILLWLLGIPIPIIILLLLLWH